MVFKSVFNSLSEVQEEINKGRLRDEDVHVRIDKMSVSVVLTEPDQFYEDYTGDEYLQSPGEPHRNQVLFYRQFDRVEEFCVELLADFLDCTSVSYRGNNNSTNFL